MDESRTPVVVASGQCVERGPLVDALDLAQRAGETALSHVPMLRPVIDQVSVVNVLSPVPPGPASALARRLGLSPSVAEVTTIGGNSPQWLANRAASAVAEGRLRAALILGAEAQRSHRHPERGDKAGANDDQTPDPTVGDTRAGMGPAEMAAGMLAPVHVYAMFESVIARRYGRSFAQHRRELGRIMAPFTEVAANHPTAWFPQRRTADELSDLSTDNRLVAEPYPKRMCAVLNVDQGSALLITSLAEARRAGYADDAVYCWSGCQVSDVWFPSARPDPGSSPAMTAAFSSALAAAGIGVDDVDAFDLYSCFPCVVQMAAEALGIDFDDRRGLTVTGGLPYFGGPGNAYTLHGLATMTDRLRRDGGVGLVTGLGWYATKHAVGIYSDRPPAGGWREPGTTDQQAAIDASTVEVVPEHHGEATVVCSTVVAGHGQRPQSAPVVARLPDGRHVAAAAEDSELDHLSGTNLVGRTVHVSGSPPRYKVAG